MPKWTPDQQTAIDDRGGALLAYLRRDRAAYDGSLRVIQDKSSRYLGALMALLRHCLLRRSLMFSRTCSSVMPEVRKSL